MLNKTDQVGYTNTYAKGKPSYKQQWYVPYATTADREKSNFPRSANECSHLFSRP
jgi:hypothetical protein